MAQGDVTFYQEANNQEYYFGWAGTDTMKCAILDNTTTPAAGDTTPGLGDYTEVGTAGTYTAGGESLGTVTNFFSQSAAVQTMDSTTNPTWAQDASNDSDAWWGLIYNDTQAGDPAIAFVELGGPVDMSASDLTITWNASGIATITIT